MFWGEVIDFKIQSFLDCANELVRADEVERALWLLNNLPAYYRDNPPREVMDLKNTILSRMCTPNAYAVSDIYLKTDTEILETMELTLRGAAIISEVRWLNTNNHIPHIIDYGPGEFWLPALLNTKNLNYTYEPIYLGEKTYQAALSYFESKLRRSNETTEPKIFYACEIIEHLWHEDDLKSDMLRVAGFCDVIHVSTPKYVFNHGCKDWFKERGDLGHLRTYTPSEFYRKLAVMFPEYEHYYYDSEILHDRMVSKITKFDLIRSSSKTHMMKLNGENE